MFLTSLTRNTDFAERRFEIVNLPREQWATGDFVAAELTETSELAATFAIETTDGRRVEVIPGDVIVGALGRRAATLELVGDWRSVGEDLRMHTLTPSGLLGRITSATTPPLPYTTVIYRGHVWRDRKLGMGDFAPRVACAALDAPVVLIIGTSMECGKTAAAKSVVRRLKAHGLRVAAVKLTGAGHVRDILAMRDAGADAIFDFVDAGLPSTMVEAATYEAALLQLLSQLGGTHPDVVVAEAGASPLEPYNGDVALRLLADRVRCTVLCASDPYAVAGRAARCPRTAGDSRTRGDSGRGRQAPQLADPSRETQSPRVPLQPQLHRDDLPHRRQAQRRPRHRVTHPERGGAMDY